MKKSSQSEECEAQTFKEEAEKIEGKEKWYRENRDFLGASLKGEGGTWLVLGPRFMGGISQKLGFSILPYKMKCQDRHILLKKMGLKGSQNSQTCGFHQAKSWWRGSREKPLEAELV